MKTYLQSCKTEFWQKVFRAEAEYLLRHLEGAGDILSVGCGPAIVEGALSRHGFRVTGLDVSLDALDCAPDSVRTVVGRAEDMPFLERSFDAVIYVASLQFVEDYGKALSETTRVLRPGGRVVVLLLNPQSSFCADRMRNPDSYIRRIRHTDLRAIEDLIAQDYDLHGEYFLGVKDDVMFESRQPHEACLYAVRGTLKEARKGEA